MLQRESDACQATQLAEMVVVCVLAYRRLPQHPTRGFWKFWTGEGADLLRDPTNSDAIVPSTSLPSNRIVNLPTHPSTRQLAQLAHLPTHSQRDRFQTH